MARNTSRISIAKPVPYTEESMEHLNSLKLIKTLYQGAAYLLAIKSTGLYRGTIDGRMLTKIW